MRNFLKNSESAFYHITSVNALESIERYGLKARNHKGISVIRSNDERIINSIIVLQLWSIEKNAINEFFLLKVNISKYNLSPSEIEPDFVDEWTWPFHNNIKRNLISSDCIESKEKIEIKDLDQANLIDFKNEKLIKDEEIYRNCFDIIYEDIRGNKYRVNEKRQKIL